MAMDTPSPLRPGVIYGVVTKASDNAPPKGACRRFQEAPRIMKCSKIDWAVDRAHPTLSNLPIPDSTRDVRTYCTCQGFGSRIHMSVVTGSRSEKSQTDGRDHRA